MNISALGRLKSLLCEVNEVVEAVLISRVSPRVPAKRVKKTITFDLALIT